MKQLLRDAQRSVKDMFLVGPLMISQEGENYSSSSSSTHCWIELLDVFYKGTDQPNAVGKLVITDFSEAFFRLRRLYFCY